MSDFHCAKFKSDIACRFKVLFVFFLLFVSFLKVFHCLTGVCVCGGGIVVCKEFVRQCGWIHTH